MRRFRRLERHARFVLTGHLPGQRHERLIAQLRGAAHARRAQDRAHETHLRVFALFGARDAQIELAACTAGLLRVHAQRTRAFERILDAADLRVQALATDAHVQPDGRRIGQPRPRFELAPQRIELLAHAEFVVAMYEREETQVAPGAKRARTADLGGERAGELLVQRAGRNEPDAAQDVFEIVDGHDREHGAALLFLAARAQHLAREHVAARQRAAALAAAVGLARAELARPPHAALDGHHEV